MSTELIECPCCGKKVPRNDIELIFKRPDEIAAMSEEEINEFCIYNQDIYNFKNERHFIRCVLPLSVPEKSDLYCIGVWVLVSRDNYKNIHDTWDEEDLSHKPSIACSLANDIPLNENTLGLEVGIQLMGKSRPEVIIKEQGSSLFVEQNSGISIHRASEYSDLCR